MVAIWARDTAFLLYQNAPRRADDEMDWSETTKVAIPLNRALFLFYSVSASKIFRTNLADFKMPARKRSVAEVATEPINRRRSVRTTTSKRSSYFEAPSDEESDLPPKKRGHHSLAKTQSSEDQYENEPEEEAFPEVTDEDDENDDDAPRKVIILPLERLRDTGGVEYDEKKLHKNTMLFLKDLKENNERKWLKCK